MAGQCGTVYVAPEIDYHRASDVYDLTHHLHHSIEWL